MKTYKISPKISDTISSDFLEAIQLLASQPTPEDHLLAAQVWIDGETINIHFHLIGGLQCKPSKL